jgi:sugar phosphate isomerase/epimerase
MIDISVMTDQLGLDFEDAVKQLADWDVEWADLRSGIYGKGIDDVTDADVERARAALEQHGLRVACLSSRVNSPWKDHDLWDEKDWDEERLRLHRLIELCKALDADLLRVYAYRKPNPDVALDRPNLEEYLGPISHRLGEAAELARAEDVRLVLENETFSLVGTCSELRQVLDAVNHTALLACWDVANGWACGEQPHPDGYEKIRDRIGYVHIKGAVAKPGSPDVYDGVGLVGQDDLDYETVLGALARDGYEGKIALHPHHNLFLEEHKLHDETNPELKVTWLTLRRMREILAGLH